MITNINTPQVNYANKYKNNQSFKGLETIPVAGLRLLSNSPAIGACAVDLGSMVIPRTAVDTKKRGVDAGIETGIREASSTVNHAAAGTVGMLAAIAASQGINSKYSGVSANKIFANNDAIDVFKSFWTESGNDAKKYYEKALSELEGLSGNVAGKKITNGISEIADELAAAPELTKDLKKSVVAKIIEQTGAENSFKIQSNGKEVADSIDVILENMHALGKAFKTVGAEKLETFAGELKHVKTRSALLGLGITSLIGISIQPINTYLTKKRTGKAGFVGVDGREPDKTNGFKLMKLAAAAAMGTLAFKTIGKNPADVLNKIQFTSKLPNLNQFKLIYGMTIMSRFLSARDKNELRESTIKDFLGFANWLILGGMVSKGVARALGKGGELINNPVAENGKKGIKYAWQWLTQSSVKSYDQVLLKEVADAGKNVLDANGKALGFKSLMDIADKATKVKVGKLALAQVAGYLYSGFVLGVGIAKLNIFITGKVEKSKKDQSKPTNIDPSVKFYAQNSSQNKPVFSAIKG